MILLTVITLAKDNPLELASTISSLKRLEYKVDFLLIDGSIERRGDKNLNELIAIMERRSKKAKPYSTK